MKTRISLLLIFSFALWSVSSLAQKTDKKLLKKIESLIKGFGGDIGVYVKDLKTGKAV